MPKKIKIFLTTYIFLIGILVIFLENKYGENAFIYLVVLLTLAMIIGIWIFPEVVTKKQNNKIN